MYRLDSRQKTRMTLNKQHLLRWRHLFATAMLVVLPSTSNAAEGPLPVVTTTTVTPLNYTLTARLPGRIKASLVAEVRPQVSGIIQGRLFEEGVTVEAGQPLYKIDDANYASAVAAANAALAEARANYDLAVIEAKRAADLFENRSGTASSRDNAAATKSKADAAVKKAEADLSRAKIDLDRTTIRAPISGVIGLSEVTQGALVAAQQATALTTIRTLDPVYVDVTQSATDLMRWTNEDGSRRLGASSVASLVLPDGTIYPYKGDIKAAEPKVEPTTGMVTLRITFANPDRRLLPGLYVEVDLPQAQKKGAIVVPQSAVMRSIKGDPYVWIVKEGKVEQRALSVFTTKGNEVVTTEGLEPGDAVITSGFQKVAVGGEVTIENGEEKSASTQEGN